MPVIPEAFAAFLEPQNEPDKGNDELFGDDSDDFFEENDKPPKDPTVDYYPTPLCDIINGLKQTCLEDSILELFGSDGDVSKETIDSLTNEDVIEAVNNRNKR